MSRKATQVEPIHEGSLLDLLQSRIGLVRHLSMQQLNSIEPPFGSRSMHVSMSRRSSFLNCQNEYVDTTAIESSVLSMRVSLRRLG